MAPHTYVVAAVIASLYSVGVIVYALSSFGNAIFFHVLYHACSVASPDLCNGGLPLVVAYITFGSIVLFPMQIVILYKHINWKLAFYLTISQQLSQYIGMYLLLTFDSIWFQRILGYFFYIVAVEMLYSNVKKRYITIEGAVSSDCITERYQIDSYKKMTLVFTTGFLSGLFSGLFATGGPPLIIFVAVSQLNSLECRATFAICFAIQNIGRIIVYLFYQSSVDVYTHDFIVVIVAVVAGASVSLLAGNYFAQFINQDKFIQVLCAVLAISSILLITSGYDNISAITIALLLVAMFLSIGYFAYRKFYLLRKSDYSIVSIEENGLQLVGINRSEEIINRSEESINPIDDPCHK